MTKIVASLVISRGDGADGFAIVELDDLSNLDSKGDTGNTQFSPNDTVYFLVQHDPSLRIDWVKSTNGMVVSLGQTSQERKDRLLWEEAAQKNTLSHIPSGGLNNTWYGNKAFGLQVEGLMDVGISSLQIPTIADTKYNANFYRYKLIAPDVDIPEDGPYPIRVVVRLERKL